MIKKWDNEGNTNVIGVHTSQTDDFLKAKVVF